MPIEGKTPSPTEMPISEGDILALQSAIQASLHELNVMLERAAKALEKLAVAKH